MQNVSQSEIDGGCPANLCYTKIEVIESVWVEITSNLPYFTHPFRMEDYLLEHVVFTTIHLMQVSIYLSTLILYLFLLFIYRVLLIYCL